MNNFNKAGYSVAETAQILHCCTVTIRRFIDEGRLGASLSFPRIEAGKKRTIRIRPEHIAEYMLKNRSKFTKEELSTWSKYAEKPKAKAEVHPEAEVTDVKNLTGAWAGLCNATTEVAAAIVAPEEKKPDIEVQYLDSYSIRIDGRISVGNVSAKTASAIIDALLKDEQISYSELTIRKGTCTK